MSFHGGASATAFSPLIILPFMLNGACELVVLFAVSTMTSRAKKKAPASEPASTKSKGKAKVVVEQPR